MAGWAQAMAVLAEVVLRMVLTESAVSAVNFQEAAAEMAPTAESRFVTPCRSSRRSHRCCQALGRSINASSPSLACAHNSGRSCCRQLHGPRPRRRAALEARECSHGRPSADRNLTYQKFNRSRHRGRGGRSTPLSACDGAPGKRSPSGLRPRRVQYSTSACTCTIQYMSPPSSPPRFLLPDVFY